MFLLAKKFDAATKMAGLALSRIPPQQTARRLEVEHLQAKILSTAAQETKFPFSKLPVELVSLIFTSALMGDAAFPINAGRVCRDWRKFIVPRPEYWQTLILSGKSPVKKLGVWIERSKGQIVVLQIREEVSYIQLHDL
ncbi:MAG TPA: hypothetical protein VGO47_08605, partial [Chlamydiales bacterium]|nr:hypothetical protein [Chlamydiales bacterium]